jgi:AcrR family transcriptional regulator
MSNMSKQAQRRTRPTREQKRQANRERILLAARRVFGARGYQAATIEEIADEAGLSNGAIYYNFASKEDLFMALLDSRMDERLAHVREALAIDPASGGLLPALEREARDITRTFKESREWRLLMLEFVAYAARNANFGKRLRDHQRELHAAVVEILEQHAQAPGITPAMPADTLATTITALLDGLAIEELTNPGAVPDELFGQAIVRLLSGSAEV